MIQVDEGRRILKIEPLTDGDFDVSYAQGLEIAQERRLQKILIDARRMVRAPRLVAVLAIILRLPEGLMVALLYRPGQAPEPEHQVAREAITNLAKQVGIFTDEAPALDWLQARE